MGDPQPDEGPAVELGPHHVRVNTILPGCVETPMSAYVSEAMNAAQRMLIPLRRFARPEDVSALAVFLASDESAYVTGAEVLVDGGVTSTLWPGLGSVVDWIDPALGGIAEWIDVAPGA